MSSTSWRRCHVSICAADDVWSGRTSNIFATSTLRATGDAFYPLLIAVIFNWTIAVGLSYLVGIPLGYGLIGMWICFALDENIRGVILMRRWRSGKWRTKGLA